MRPGECRDSQALEQAQVEAVGECISERAAVGVGPHRDGVIGVQVQDIEHSNLVLVTIGIRLIRAAPLLPVHKYSHVLTVTTVLLHNCDV